MCHRGGGWFASSSLGDNDDDRRLLVEWPEGERRGSSCWSAKATSSTGTGTGTGKNHLVLRRRRACNLIIPRKGPPPSERLLLLRGVRDPMGRSSRLRGRLLRLGRRLRPGDTAAPCLRRGDAASLQPVLRAASLASPDLLCPGTRRGLSRLPLPGRPRERWRSHPVLY